MQRQASAVIPAPLACIFAERASFELRDEDVEALRRKVDSSLVLRACHAGQQAEAEAARAKEEEELRAWKARSLHCACRVLPGSCGHSVTCFLTRVMLLAGTTPESTHKLALFCKLKYSKH